MYTIPDDYRLELHHVRPRFKNDVENVLFYIASVCKNIKTTDTIRYNEQVFNAIKLYPGNENSTRKTINNWRTEIAALFGFYIEDKVTRTTRTGRSLKALSTRERSTSASRHRQWARLTCAAWRPTRSLPSRPTWLSPEPPMSTPSMT